MVGNPDIDTEWIVQFLNKGGLDRLFDTVEHVFSQPIESLMGTMKQMECLKMLKVRICYGCSYLHVVFNYGRLSVLIKYSNYNGKH